MALFQKKTPKVLPISEDPKKSAFQRKIMAAARK